MSGARKPWATGIALLVLTISGLAPRAGRADAVDEAYAAAGEAAARQDWAAAVEHYERARKILPERSAQLSYDLGTAYANLGELGYATYHLARALDDPAGLDAELAEDARRNAAIVRRRLELSAAGDGTRISEPEDARDAIVRAMASTLFAWIALGFGAGAFVAWSLRMVGRAKARGVALAVFASLAFVLLGSAHVLARSGDRAQAASIVLPIRAEVREGPGTHTPRSFSLSGGSRVWVQERRSGWSRVQTPSGLEGWTQSEALGALDAPVGAVSPPEKDASAASTSAPDNVGKKPT